MRKLSVASRTRAAFTLLEVLMVVAIIGLLAAFVVPQLWGSEEKAKVKLAQAAIDGTISSALNRYRLDMGHYPREEDDGLMALVEPPDDEEDLKKWGGPYLKAKDLKDNWGNDYIYEYDNRQYNEDSFDLSSAGPDLEEGTEDDITNWEKD